MPLENFEEEGLAKNPNLELAQWKFMLLSEQYKNDSDIKGKLLEAVKAGGTCCLLFYISCVHIRSAHCVHSRAAYIG